MLTRLALHPASPAAHGNAVEDCKQALRIAVPEVHVVFVELELDGYDIRSGEFAEPRSAGSHSLR